jgi:transcriptional repressor NrdR
VKRKREVIGTSEIRRRRECLKCHKRYTTYERVAGLELVVLKRDGHREAFDREKLKRGVVIALEKRPAGEQADLLIDKIESKLRLKGDRVVNSKVIGQAVLAELKKLDEIAYLRFASVYRSFQNTGDFSRELESLEKVIKLK